MQVHKPFRGAVRVHMSKGFAPDSKKDTETVPTATGSSTDSAEDGLEALEERLVRSIPNLLFVSKLTLDCNWHGHTPIGNLHYRVMHAHAVAVCCAGCL